MLQVSTMTAVNAQSGRPSNTWTAKGTLEGGLVIGAAGMTPGLVGLRMASIAPDCYSIASIVVVWSHGFH